MDNNDKKQSNSADIHHKELDTEQLQIQAALEALYDLDLDDPDFDNMCD